MESRQIPTRISHVKLHLAPFLRLLSQVNTTSHILAPRAPSRIKLSASGLHQTRTIRTGPGKGPLFRKHYIDKSGTVKRPLIAARNNRGVDGRIPNPLEQVSTTTTKGSDLPAPILVRDACKCSQCIDPSDRQRNFCFSDIPGNISFRDVQVDEKTGALQIRWDNDIPSYGSDHISTFDRETLDHLMTIYRHQGRNKLYTQPLKLWDRESFQQDTQRLDFNDYMTHGPSFAKAMHLLWRDGLVFIDAVPESESSVAQIVNRIGPLQQTFYGPTWDVRSVPQAKNVAYTSKYLGFHMDLLYMRDPPGFQFLHCVHNSCEGGESRFADTFKAVDQLVAEYGREYLDPLKSYRVRYEYDNDGFFYSDRKATVELRSNFDEPPRRVLHAQHDQIIGDVGHVFWSPPFVGHIPWQTDLAKYSRFLKATKAFADIMERPRNVYQEKMDGGTCVIFDNLRVVHARNAFDLNSGKRWLRGAYLNRQDFISKAVSVVDDMPLDHETELYTSNLGRLRRR